MARPERPVEGDGPVAELARELRRIRRRAGNPGYRELAVKANSSKTTLSSAAYGKECPCWDVVKAYADACDPTGTETRRLRDLWDKADKADRTRRRRRAPARRPATRPPHHTPAGRSPQPDPDGTAADYIYQLRALRAWAGNPGSAEVSPRRGDRLAKSTMYEALSPRRTTLPPFRPVRLIVQACLDDPAAIEEWLEAWRSIAHREFTRANPRPQAVQPDNTRPALRIVADK